jgi:hypothetical protein
MSFQGLHMMFYLISITGVIYAALVIASLIYKEKLKWIDFYKNPRFHIVLVIMFLILAVSRPFKLQSQSDEAKAAVRHSFDTPVYVSDRKTEKVSNPTYSLDDIRKQQADSQEQWDNVN